MFFRSSIQRTKEEASFFSKERINALSDGIFAIAMTLLVLDIRLPEGLDPSHLDKFYKEISGLFPLFLSYIISFMVSAGYWGLHHRLMTHIERIDASFTRWSLFFLFWITLLPVSSNFFGQWASVPLMVGFYAANMAACGIALSMLAFHAASGQLLVDDEGEQAIVKRIGWRTLAAASAFGLSILVLLLPDGIHWVYYVWLLFPFMAHIIRFFEQYLIDPVRAIFKGRQKVSEIASTGPDISSPNERVSIQPQSMSPDQEKTHVQNE